MKTEVRVVDSFRTGPTMRLKSYFFLLVNLAVSSALSLPMVQVEVIDFSENNTRDLTLDDIREPLNIQRSSILPGSNQWTSPVPYVLDEGLDLRAKGVIMRAFDQFRVKTCIDFKPWDSEDYYIHIKKLDGCWSYVGRTFSNGQDLSIGAGCDYIAIVEHELLHALGFYHEQSRYDRDDYVRIVYDNIIAGTEYNFNKVESDVSTTHGVPYDYMSVMHYGKDAFNNGNGNGTTIITIDPKYQDVIGQRLDMSPSDALELNLLYNCNTTIAFKFYCGFSDGSMCQMSRSSGGQSGWEVVTQAQGGPSSDHTTLPSGSEDYGQQTGYFIHVSTTSGQEGDSARLETKVVKPTRACKVQCLQFYYFHSGNTLDELNIWIREFQNEQDTTGTLRLMGQITGSPTSHWKFHHVSLNATKDFQVVFEVRKGAGNSTGGFSIDDINLSETECPHFAWQIDDLEILLNTSSYGDSMTSPRQFSKDGYAYLLIAVLYKTYVSMFVQLLSSKNDNQLQYPCLQRHMIFQLLDQTPNKQLQMSKEITLVSASDLLIWGNPRETGYASFYENEELVYAGKFAVGFSPVATLQELQSREFLKGGSAIFMFNFEDLTPLINGTNLPCPARVSPSVSPPSTPPDYRVSSTVYPSSSTRRTSTIVPPPGPTTNHRTSSSTHPPPTTEKRISSTIIPPPPGTTDDRTLPTIHPPTTTDNRISSTIFPPPPGTTDDRIFPTNTPPPATTDDDSIFDFCPGMVASPILAVLLALILLLS